MLEQYRFLSARDLLGLERLDRFQSLPPESWTPVGELDLAGVLVEMVRGEGLGCRDERDYVLVALLLLRSLMAGDAVGDVGIWRGALGRFVGGLDLVVVRREDGLGWLECKTNVGKELKADADP